LPRTSPPEKRKLTHEEFMERLRTDPRFIAHEPRGEAFIIGGQNPAHPKPKKPEGDGA
jgi:hypothetical protein